MRLTDHQQQLIKENTQQVFGIGSNVLLFGSRTNDSERGGDIDLLIELAKPTKNLLRKNLTLNALLQQAMGGAQKIDIITFITGSVKNKLQAQAFSTGIRL